jgi:hypothetical protein
MIDAEQLLAHAARCTRLAELCRDPAVAKKLRQLAQDYRELASLPPENPDSRPKPGDPHLEPAR